MYTYLLKFLVFFLDETQIELDKSLQSFLVRHSFQENVLENGRKIRVEGTLPHKIATIMNIWQELMSRIIDEVREDIFQGRLMDSPDRRLYRSTER